MSDCFRVPLVVFCIGIGFLPAVVSAQEDQQETADTMYVARQDITSDGVIIATAGEMVSVVRLEGDNAIISRAGNKQYRVARSVLASMDEAIDVLNKLIQDAPKEARLYASRANVRAAQGDFTSAVVDATRAIELSDRKEASYFVNRGAFYSAAGDLKNAVADYIQATHLAPSQTSIFTSLAAAWIKQGEYEKAAEVCTKVIKVDPKQPAHYLQRGVAWRYLEKYDKAIEDFSKALELDSENLAALTSRGFVYYLKGDHRSAVQDFDAAVRLAPDDPMIWNNRGYNRFLTGDYSNALADYNKALELLPTYTMAWQNKAWLLATAPDDSIRNGKEAVAAAKKAVDLRQEQNPGDLKALAAAYAESGDFDKAVEYQKKVVELLPEEQRKSEQDIVKLYQDGKPFRSKPPEVAK